MHKILKKSMVYFLVASLVLVPMAGTVLAEDIYKEEISSEKMAADLVLVRPVGFCFHGHRYDCCSSSPSPSLFPKKTWTGTGKKSEKTCHQVNRRTLEVYL